jgi:hypothetical protein
MKNQPEDTIRRALQDLRDADESSAPDFDAVQERPARVYRFDSRRAVTMAFAASVLLLTGTVIVREVTRPRLVVPPEVIALSAWQPMTDALLEGLPDVIGDAPLTGSLLPMPGREITTERMP